MYGETVKFPLYLFLSFENFSLLWCYSLYRRFEGLQYPRIQKAIQQFPITLTDNINIHACGIRR